MQGLVGGSVYNTMRTGAETVPQQTLNNSSVPLGNTQLDGERPRGWAQEACVRQLLPWDCCFSTRAEGPKPPPPRVLPPKRKQWPRPLAPPPRCLLSLTGCGHPIHSAVRLGPYNTWAGSTHPTKGNRPEPSGNSLFYRSPSGLLAI